MPIAWQTIAEMFVERVTNSMLEGVAIALFAWILLRVLGRQNSSTRFAVWFSAILAIAALPLFGTTVSAKTSIATSAFRLPASSALYVFIAWAMIALAGLARIAFSFARLRKLRQSCTAIDLATLDPTLPQQFKRGLA